MNYTPPSPPATAAEADSQPAASQELEQIEERIRASLEAIQQAINETDAKKLAFAMAAGDNLNLAHDVHVPERDWGKFLKKLGIGRTKAFEYGLLAKHRAEVEAFVRRGEQMGEKPLSIKRALKLIGHGRPDPIPRPKTLTEVETPAVLGPFLNSHRELFREALQFAPGLKAMLEECVLAMAASLADENSKAAKKAADELRTIIGLTRNRSDTNREDIRTKATHALGLLEPEGRTKLTVAALSNAKLDTGAFNKGLALPKAA
jgi:hypothetical protein